MSGQHVAAFFPGPGVLDTDVFRQYHAACPDIVAMFAEVDAVARKVCGTPLPRTPQCSRHSGVDVDLSIFLGSIASYRTLVQRGLQPRAIVGHGFGEIAALVAGDALSLGDGAEIVARRHQALAAKKTRSRMGVLKLPAGHVHTFLRVLNDATVSIAAENAPTHTVIVGSPSGLAAAEDLARLLGLSFQRLTTTWGPHRASLRGIEQQLLGSLTHVARRALQTPVYSPLLGRFYRAEDDVVAAIAEQLVEPVRFADAVRDLVTGGVTLFVEVGPLRGLSATLACRAVSDIHFRIPRKQDPVPTQLEVA